MLTKVKAFTREERRRPCRLILLTLFVFVILVIVALFVFFIALFLFAFASCLLGGLHALVFCLGVASLAHSLAAWPTPIRGNTG
jgi:hypothetical protein